MGVAPRDDVRIIRPAAILDERAANRVLDEHTLDAWEGALGVYEKIRVRIQTLEGDRLAWLYVLNAFEGGLPSARYLGIMADAAEAAGAPDDYVDDLRRRPCRNIGP